MIGGSAPNISSERQLKKPISEVKEGVYSLQDVEIRRSSLNSSSNSVEIIGGKEPFWATLRKGVSIKEGVLSLKLVKSGSFIEITQLSQLKKETKPFTLIEGRKVTIENSIRTLPNKPECKTGEAILVGDKIQRIRCL